MENKIIAEGEVNGVRRHVECFMENGSPIIEVNYEFDEEEQERFEKLLKTPQLWVEHIIRLPVVYWQLMQFYSKSILMIQEKLKLK